MEKDCLLKEIKKENTPIKKYENGELLLEKTIKLTKKILKKYKISNKFQVNFGVGNVDLFYESEIHDLVWMPNDLFNQIKQDLLKEEGPPLIFSSMGGNKTEISCNRFQKKESEKKLKNVVLNFFKNKVIDIDRGFEEINYKKFPKTKDVINYGKTTRELYELAIEGFSNNKKFKAISVGGPGTGKTWFAKILTRHLMENKKIFGTVMCSPSSIQFADYLLTKIKSKKDFFFVLDEMERGLADRSENFADSDSVKPMLSFLDGISSSDNVRFLGISNVPHLMDKSLFRPGRMHLIVSHEKNKMTAKTIENILKSGNRKEATNKDIEVLSRKIIKEFPDEMPVSFYSLAFDLYLIYKKKWDKTFKPLCTFYENKKIFEYQGESFLPKNKSTGIKEGFGF